jgi:hypothetical protein
MYSGERNGKNSVPLVVQLRVARKTVLSVPVVHRRIVKVYAHK